MELRASFDASPRESGHLMQGTGPGSVALQPFQPIMHQPDRRKTIYVARPCRSEKILCTAIARHGATQIAETIEIVANPDAA
jgi:hypothetical protein